MPTLQPGSREFILIPLTADGDPAATFPTEVAFGTSGQAFDPDVATWYTATQVDAETLEILVGPGGTAELAAGKYTIYARVTAPPELPILKAGSLTIT